MAIPTLASGHRFHQEATTATSADGILPRQCPPGVWQSGSPQEQAPSDAEWRGRTWKPAAAKVSAVSATSPGTVRFLASAPTVMSSVRSSGGTCHRPSAAHQPNEVLIALRGKQGDAQTGDLIGPVDVRVECARPLGLEDRARILPVGEPHGTRPGEVPVDRLDHPAASGVAVAEEVDHIEVLDDQRPV